MVVNGVSAPSGNGRRVGDQCRSIGISPKVVLYLALTGLALACPPCAGAELLLRGKVVGVADGDTITVLDARSNQHRIRLYQIDAPEKGQDFGAAAKKSLSRLIYKRDISVSSVTTDRYQRTVGTVYLAGTDINLEQVKRGMAWVYRQYAKDPRYLAAEQQARTRRIGLWARSNPVPPWEFRRERDGHDGYDVRRWFKRFW